MVICSWYNTLVGRLVGAFQQGTIQPTSNVLCLGADTPSTGRFCLPKEGIFVGEYIRSQFTFCREYLEITELLPKERQCDFLMSIIEYALCGTMPDYNSFSDMEIMGFDYIKQKIDKSPSDRYTKEYSEWRTSVFERDDYTCQRCGKRGGKLNAHHIERYRDCIERRTDVSNGVTLCEDCHRLIHRIEGR